MIEESTAKTKKNREIRDHQFSRVTNPLIKSYKSNKAINKEQRQMKSWF